MKNWEQYGVDYYNKLQKEIILLGAKMLKPGGKMLYSTCTFSPEENEGTIKYLLENCPEFHVLNPIEYKQSKEEVSYEGFSFGRPEWVDGPEELKNCIRLWPHRIHGEGHFITLLEKSTSNEADYEIGKLNHGSLSGEAEDFILTSLLYINISVH